MLKQRLLLPLGLAAFAAGLALAAVLLRPTSQPLAPGITLITAPHPVAAFELRDQHNEIFNSARLHDKWSLLFFGYTHCPDVCPSVLATLKQVQAQLGETGRNIQYIFVTVDPERDTTSVLQSYVGYFSPTFIGVRGTDAELNKLTQSLGIYYHRGQAPPGQVYEVDHSAAVILVGPDANMRALFSAPQRAADMAENLRRLSQAG